MVYGFIGTGAITAAIVTGLCDGQADAPQILVSPRNRAVSADLAQRFASVRVAADNQAVIDGASALILAVRPQDAAAALAGLAFPPHMPIISLMAGRTVARVRELVAPATDVVRAIPLPAVSAREGATPIFPASDIAIALFDRLGTALPVADEDAFAAFGAATATMASYFTFIRAIADWLVGRGIPAEQAQRYLAAVFAGLAGPLRRGERDFARLAHDHATPGGLNERLLGYLTEAGAFASVQSGLDDIASHIARAMVD